MKKALIGSAVCALNLITVYGTLTPRNSGWIANHRENGGVFTGYQGDVATINLRAMRSPTVQGDIFRIRVHDRRDGNGNLIVPTDWYTRDYPLQRTIVFDSDFANGLSHPIERLCANINGIQFADCRREIVVYDEFVNLNRSFSHTMLKSLKIQHEWATDSRNTNRCQNGG